MNEAKKGDHRHYATFRAADNDVHLLDTQELSNRLAIRIDDMTDGLYDVSHTHVIEHANRPRREVEIAAHRLHPRPLPLAQLDEVLQLPRMPMQPIGVVDDHRLHDPSLDLLQHAQILRPPLPAVAR